MTVCIAGICWDRDLPRIILCSDQRIGTDESGGDVCLKMDHAGDGWIALISGSVPKARDFVAVCRKAMMERTDSMDSADIALVIRECASRQKLTLADQYVQSQLAFSYDYLLAHGKEQLPKRDFDEVIYNVRSINLGCDIVLAGFVGSMPVLFTVWNDGTVNKEEAFAVVGSGCLVAQAALFRRQYRLALQIEEAAYYLYEAKKMSEIGSGIGPGTSMSVLKKGRPGYVRYKHVDGFTMAELEQQYKACGIQEYRPAVHGRIQGTGFSFTEDQSNPQSTTDGQQSPPALLE